MARRTSGSGGDSTVNVEESIVDSQPAGGEASLSSGPEPAAGESTAGPEAGSSAAQEIGDSAAQGATDLAQASGSAAPAQPAQTSWRDMLADAGFSALRGMPDDRQAVGWLQDLARQAIEAQQRAAQYEQLLQQQQMAAAQQQQPAQQQEPWHKKHWSPPEFNRAALAQWVQPNPETGANEFKPDTPPSVKQAYAEYVAYMRDWKERYEANPAEFTWNMLQDQVRNTARETFDHLYSERFGRYQNEQYAHSFVQQNPWIFSLDQHGQPVRDPITGAYVRSPEGSVFTQHLTQASQWGMPQDSAVQYALQMVHAYLATAGAKDGANGFTQPSGTSQPPLDPRQAYVQQAAARGAPQPANRTGTFATQQQGGPPQNPNESFREAATRAAREAGIAI